MINTLHLGLSYACNMDCSHCFVDKKRDQLSVEKIKQILTFLYNEGLFYVFYTYGEPLLSDKFEEIAMFCKKMGLVQILMTNGSLIDKNKAIFIKKCGITRVYVSLDSSDRSEHDTNRNHVGAYEKAINSIRCLKEESLSVGIATTINESNKNRCFELWSLANNLGVNVVSFLRERQRGRIVEFGKENEYYSFVEWYLKSADKQKINLLTHDITLLPLVKKISKENNNTFLLEKYTVMNCCHAMNTVSVAPNGDVSFCNLNENILGNVNRDSFERIIREENINECTVCGT